MKDLITRLAEYGLSEKESLVYLAMLELGPASVQDIAKKAGVNRATTYVMIESLKRRGLMSTFDKGRKTFFVAESPEHLKRLSETELRAAEEKANRLKQSLPLFMALFNSASASKPMVRYYEGEEGVSTCRAMVGMANGEILNFVARDEGTIALSKLNENERLELGSRVHGRIIVAIKPGMPDPKYDKAMWQKRTIPYETFPFTGDMIFFENKIFIFFMQDKPYVFLIESPEMFNMLKSMFELAWQQAKQYEG
ncbi:MAG: helix-turn-helix domain-containing protein [Patescibacteria group bacterium]|nr:helix-turn-helix domain-containing protein [Patescibacteria group bacterium]